MTSGTAPCITRSFIPFLPNTNPEDREDVALHRGNYFSADDQWMLHCEEKCGKSREIPVRHDLEPMLFECIEAAGLTISINKLFNQSKRRTMKNKIFTFAVIGCMAGIFLAGCGKTPERKVEEARQDLKDAKADYLAEWQKFKAESEEQIKANEDRIDAFKEKMEKAGAKTKAKYNQEVVELEKKNRDLKKQLEEYKDEGESKWQEFKTNFGHDMDAVGKTMKDLFKDND